MGQNGTKEKLQCVADYRLAVERGTSASDICEGLRSCFGAGGAPFTFDDVSSSSKLVVKDGNIPPAVRVCACAIRHGDVANVVDMYEKMAVNKDLHRYAIEGYYKGLETTENAWALSTIRRWIAGDIDSPYDWHRINSSLSEYVSAEYIPSLRILVDTCEDSLRATATTNLLVTCWITGKLDFPTQLRRVLAEPSEELVAARAELEAAKAKIAQAILGDMERS